MRLLLVEDEIDLLNALERGLRQEGYAVDVALTGTQALELATVHDYDLLILDLNLPEIDGLEVCRRLRHDKPELLILMLTARAGPRDRVKGLDLGADDYLIKPFYFDELKARMEEHDMVNWSAVTRAHIQQELDAREERTLAKAVATSERLSATIDPAEVDELNTADRIREWRERRYGPAR